MIIKYFSKKLSAVPRERFITLEREGYAPLFTMVQRHGDNIIRLSETYKYPGLDALIKTQPEGDAVVTSLTGLFIGVKTADCVPILLWDETVVAAVHAGWRGTAADIAGKTARVMREEFFARNIRAAIGPCICQSCFVTGGDVPEAMPTAAHEYIRKTAPGRYQADLRGINAALLRKEGVSVPDETGICTACNPDIYWSHRKHGTDRGLQVSLIGRAPDGAGILNKA